MRLEFLLIALAITSGCTYYLGEQQSRFDLRFNPPNGWKVAENTPDFVRFVPEEWETSLGPTPELKVELVKSDEALDTFMRRDKEMNIAKLKDYRIERYMDIIVVESEGVTEYSYADPAVDEEGARIKVHKHYFYGVDGIVVVTISASLKFWNQNEVMLNECIKSFKFQ
ncbi:MAG: hypothetical protein N2234_02690 [Planctomycetota bacterium]|nr:hypothetical protein [Planctomycetota bacterium]